MERNEVRDWHRIDIVAELHKRGVTMRSLSTSAGLARSYPKGERIIASALNLEPSSIWPSRYNKDL